jgi:hypothetical protein
LIDLKTDPPNTRGTPERRTKPISRREKELTEALDFLVSNLQVRAEEYHHKARKAKRCEAILEEAISELIARKERETGAGGATRWRKRRSR